MSNFNKSQRIFLAAGMSVAILGMALRSTAADGPLDYRILATSKTSTMEMELNEAAAADIDSPRPWAGNREWGSGSHRCDGGMPGCPNPAARYKLLATSRTSTMQRELQRAAIKAMNISAQSVFQSAFGGREVVVILEADPSRPRVASTYRLLATTKTSTMQKELQEAGERGYVLLGLTVGKTAYRRRRILAILRKNSSATSRVNPLRFARLPRGLAMTIQTTVLRTASAS